MADTKKATTKKKATTRAASGKGGSSTVWTDEEKAAMAEHAREMKVARGKAKPDGEADVQAKIAEMPPEDRALAERIHAIVKETAPELTPRTWYGMPAYANGAGKVVCFFTPGAKFKERYASLGFNPDAHLDEGTMWPTAWALTKLTPANEKKIAELVKKAAG
jgi:uncharacterized protein YdhG (YjbR/CyaY superfamily)